MTPPDPNTPVVHPLETVFELEEGSTLVHNLQMQVSSIANTTPTPEVSVGSYDERDQSIEEQLTRVQSEALLIVDTLKQTIMFADSKGASRAAEVSVQALNAALDAIRQKADVKKHKDKITATGGINSIQTTNNNTLVVDRNQLLSLISDQHVPK